MASVGDILNDDGFFSDVADTPEEGMEQHKKREELKSVIDKGKLGQNGRIEGWTRQVIKLLTKHMPSNFSLN